MTYQEIVDSVAQDTGLSSVFVDKVYRSYWRAIREHIKELPLKMELSDDEFKELRPNINIPSIGKLHVTLDRYHRTNKVKEYKKDKTNND